MAHQVLAQECAGGIVDTAFDCMDFRLLRLHIHCDIGGNTTRFVVEPFQEPAIFQRRNPDGSAIVVNLCAVV